MKLLILKTPFFDEELYDKFLEAIKNLSYELQGFLAFNESESWTAFKNYQVYPFYHLKNLDYDLLLVACHDGGANNKIFQQLINVGIPREKLNSTLWLLKKELQLKYEYCNDVEIQDTLKFWDTHELGVFNQYFDGVQSTYNEVFFDPSCKLPFIIFKTIDDKYVKMYYPLNHSFVAANGKFFVVDVLKEQIENSPHLYVTPDHKVEEGDIIIDAGVCEGNFALRYVNISSKIYLFETDPNWAKPLYYTFKNFQHKVEFFPRAVSDVTDESSIRLDDAVFSAWQGGGGGQNFFLKMDIEGAEKAALRGAKRLLSENNVKSSICSYHCSEDELKIKSILQSYGYKTSTSKGHMIFIYDKNIWNTLDFRRGIVYAHK